nr:SJCHGC06834 protein [Schistosoma japonicum]
MAILHPYRSTAEFLVHHFIIFLCFSSALLSGKYIGYAAVSLLPEVNSIFLHLRRAMNYLRVPKGNRFFHTTCLLNIGEFQRERSYFFLFYTVSYAGHLKNLEEIKTICRGRIPPSLVSLRKITYHDQITY